MSAPVLIYVSRYCGWCTRALALLEAKGVDPEVIVVDTNRELRGEMEARSGRRTVPQIFIGERHIGGFDDLSALDAAGQLDRLLVAEQA
ncbi:MAG: glutaredoxin 3 [Gammaproteobacteria bacterium]